VGICKGISFISIVRMIIKAKQGTLGVEDLYNVYSALPFMWLLAMSIVTIVHERSRLRELENELTREQQQRRITELQLATLKEAEKVLQHKINNPLAVIALSISRLKRASQRDHVFVEETNDTEYASQKIDTVLTDFRGTQVQ
jgi:hypothetical protein